MSAIMADAVPTWPSWLVGACITAVGACDDTMLVTELRCVWQWTYYGATSCRTYLILLRLPSKALQPANGASKTWPWDLDNCRVRAGTPSLCWKSTRPCCASSRSEHLCHTNQQHPSSGQCHVDMTPDTTSSCIVAWTQWQLPATAVPGQNQPAQILQESCISRTLKSQEAAE